MKPIMTTILTGALLALSACGGQPDMKTLCDTMVAGDVEAAEEVARDNMSLADFCTCYDQQISLTADVVQERHRAVFGAIIDLRQTNNVGVEPAAEMLETILQAPTNTYDFTEADFDAVGDFLNDVEREFRSGGACEAGG